MIEHFPHSCSYELPSEPDRYDEVKGRWIKGTPGDVVVVPCRARPNGAGRTVQNQDGVAVEYSYDLSFPADASAIARGTELEIKDKESNVLIKSRLLNYQAGEFHGRGWI